MPSETEQFFCHKQKEIIMSSSGSKDKGNKEQKKKPKHNLKEKRKLKNEKKQKVNPFKTS